MTPGRGYRADGAARWHRDCREGTHRGRTGQGRLRRTPAFCDDIEAEVEAKARQLATTSRKPVDLSLAPVRVMREFLRRRQMEESGVTGVSIWAESHAAIHTWDEDNYYAFDAFSCRDFRPRDALRLLLSHFDIEMLNCVNLFRYQRSIPRVSNFQVNVDWEVILDGRVVGELDSVDFTGICGTPAAPPGGAGAAAGDEGGGDKRRLTAARPAHKRSIRSSRRTPASGG